MALRIEALTFAYPGHPPILRDVGLEMGAGDLVAVCGANGSGKSTLARLVAGLEPAPEGTVLCWNDRSWREWSAVDRTRAVQFVGQRPDLQISGRGATLREEVAFGPENLCLDVAEIRRRVSQALALMDLDALAERDCRSLSGGETQRLAIACALAMRPHLLVLDEPATDIDAEASQALANLLRDPPWPMATIIFDIALRDPLASAITRWFGLSSGTLSKVGARAALPPRPFPEGWVQAHAPRTGMRKHSAGSGLDIEGLSFAWPAGRRVLSGFDLALPEGCVAAVIGPNGSGKSTLLRLIAGLEVPTAGRIRIGGTVLDGRDRRSAAARVGLVFQSSDRHVLSSRVIDEVAFASRMLRLPQPRERAEHALDQLGLRSVAESHPHDLDAGKRRLVAVAAAIAHRPDVLLLDETQRSLDDAHLERLESVIREEAASGKTILLATHDIPFARRVASHIVDLRPPA